MAASLEGVADAVEGDGLARSAGDVRGVAVHLDAVGLVGRVAGQVRAHAVVCCNLRCRCGFRNEIAVDAARRHGEGVEGANGQRGV